MNQNLKLKGKYVVTLADCSSRVADSLARKIERLRRAGEEYMPLVRELNERFCERKEVFHNIVPNTGLYGLAETMVTTLGSISLADSPHVTYGAVGTGSTTPAAGDTTLVTEVFRSSIDSQSRSNNIAYNTLFIGLSEANGNTFEEFGLFAGNASGTADTGKLMSRVLLSPSFAKTASKTLTLDASHTFSDV